MATIPAPTLDIGANGQWKGTQGTITADKPVFSSTATWNDAGVTHTHIKANVTDTASAAASMLIDLQVGGSTKFNVTKAGNLFAVGRGAVGTAAPGGFDTDSQFTIAGSIGSGLTGDHRAVGIGCTIYPDNTGGTRSSEGINCHFDVVLPASGAIASIEGVHVDLSGNSGGGSSLWDDGGASTATVGFVAGFRVRGVTIPSTGGSAEYVYGLCIDSGLGGGTTASYNIFSAGATARNRFDGYLEVYGVQKHAIGSYATSITAGPQTYYGLFVGPEVTGDGGIYGTRIMQVAGQASPAATRNGYGFVVTPIIALAGSGAHSDFVGAQFEIPDILAGVGTVQNATTLKVMGAPTEGSSQNYALWVVGGASKFGGTLEVAELLTASKGVVFPATQVPSADANTLDDYEEGTWTPAVGGTATYTGQTGTYTKVGRLVRFSFDLTINAIGTGSTTAVSGLPFSAAAGTHGGYAVYFSNVATGVVSLFGDISGTTFSCKSLIAAAQNSGTSAIFQDGTRVLVVGSYEV